MIKEILQDASKKLGSNLEARILLSYATGYSQEYLIGYSNESLSTEIVNEFYRLIERRIQKEPIAYIVGYKEFYGRNFIVDKNVLIPRNDSEVLIDAVLSGSCIGKILELGVGSGCLILTLLLEMPHVRAVGVDISNKALNIAKRNMLQHGLSARCKLMQSNWFKNIDEKFDIIISNPPYISENDKSIMAEETLLYEPRSALYGRNNGYEAYDIIAANLKDYLKPEGKLYIEIGINQAVEIEKIFGEYGYYVTGKYKDLSGILRVLSLGVTLNQ
jgi:release factor glutamine methyltransferase